MKVLDSGHNYSLQTYDGEAAKQFLTFMKREGPGYPFNVGHYSGTNCQEVLRALIERCLYLNKQVPCGETEAVINHLRQALWLFECRAARRHGRVWDMPVSGIENHPTCQTCGHINCGQEHNK